MQARIGALRDLSEQAFTTILDVDVVETNTATGEKKMAKRSFVPLDHAVALREGLEEALRGLNHYRDALKARILSDSAFSGADMSRIDAESPESGESGPNHAS